MSFVPKKQAFNSKINAVTLGTGDKATVLGGQNVLPFYTFDAPVENKPKIGVEITDAGMEMCTTPGLKDFADTRVNDPRTREVYTTEELTRGDLFFLRLHPLRGRRPQRREQERGGVRRAVQVRRRCHCPAHRGHGLQERR